MKVVHDVLDKELIDRNDEPIGRVDGLVMHVGERTQPRITHIAVGGTALWERVHPAFGRVSKRLARVWGPKRTEQVRIPWSRVKTAGRDIKLDVEGKETGAIDWEIWISRNIIKRIPGAGGDEEDDGNQS
jgi:sporulation protein YlmC with PRC-barrel domain